MSSLDDSDGGAPRKRAKGEKKEKGKAKAKGAKHESELKRLQSYVNACGAFSSPPSPFRQTLMQACRPQARGVSGSVSMPQRASPRTMRRLNAPLCAACWTT
jgi:hypothetical protein